MVPAAAVVAAVAVVVATGAAKEGGRGGDGDLAILCLLLGFRYAWMHECSEAGMQICMDVSYHRVHCAAVVAKASSEL